MSLLVSYLYGCLCAFVPCAAYLFVARRGKSRSQGLVLALYLALVMAVTGAGTLWDLLRPSEPGYSNIILNFQPLANGLRRDICLNVVMLVPLGFLLPLWWRDYQRLAPTVVAGAGNDSGSEALVVAPPERQEKAEGHQHHDVEADVAAKTIGERLEVEDDVRIAWLRGAEQVPERARSRDGHHEREVEREDEALRARLAATCNEQVRGAGHKRAEAAIEV